MDSLHLSQAVLDIGQQHLSKVLVLKQSLAHPSVAGHDESESSKLVNVLNVFFWAILFLDEVVKGAEASNIDD